MAPYPGPSYGADTTVAGVPGDFIHYDGELIPNPAGGTGSVIVAPLTQLPTFGGIQSAPIVIDDPDNPNGAQLLIVGNNNGRVYAFDAGGRGDFIAVNAGNISPVTTLNIETNRENSGTTQRISTWPRPGQDFWRANGDYTNFSNVPGGEAAKGPFVASPSFDPNGAAVLSPTVTINSPILVGSLDTHLYAVDPAHDKFVVKVNGVPQFIGREVWQYPNTTTTLDGPIRTAAIFNTTGTASATGAYVYFTSGGRVYSVNEFPQLSMTTSATATENWVFPSFNRQAPPGSTNPDPSVYNQAALDPSFEYVPTYGIGSASLPPVIIPSATVQLGPNAIPPTTTPPDLCYVLLTDGMLLALNADVGVQNQPADVNLTPQTTLFAAGSAGFTSTRCAPIVADLQDSVGGTTVTMPPLSSVTTTAASMA